MRTMIGLMLLLLIGCTGKAEETYTMEDAKADGYVVVEHKGNTFDQIVQGAIEIENLQQINNVLEAFKNGKTQSATIYIFDSDGNYYKNSLKTEGRSIQFENNYGGYKGAPKGSFSCEYIEKRGPIVYLESCSREKGEDISTMIGFVGSEKEFKEAK
ncbi:hypothetical protein [Halobacillus mangrovi]|uniref:hypothetical protein n=1 Tax=Halobacillus mangrovi TaxID=402384 RepID=UPI003D99B35F